MALAIVITLERDIGEAGAAYTKAGTGKALARESEKLDYAARCCNIAQPSTMLSESQASLIAQLKADGFDPAKMRLPPERFFPPSDGLKVVRTLHEHVSKNLNDFKQPNPILRDLKAVEALLAAAESAGVKFHFTKSELQSMPGKFHHEQLYRGQDVIDKLAGLRLTLCGAGALGSNLADNLVRQGVHHLRVIDHDRIEEHNVSTQLYGESEVGGWKVDVLRNRLFRAAGVEIDAVRKQLDQANAAQLIRESGLVVDTFDNSLSRSLVQGACRASSIACLHVGLFEDYGEVIWDAQYRVPSDVAGDVCDYPLARNLVMMTVAIASEAIVRFARDGSKPSFSVTLNDFAVRELSGT